MTVGRIKNNYSTSACANAAKGFGGYGVQVLYGFHAPRTVPWLGDYRASQIYTRAIGHDDRIELEIPIYVLFVRRAVGTRQYGSLVPTYRDTALLSAGNLPTKNFTPKTGDYLIKNVGLDRQRIEIIEFDVFSPQGIPILYTLFLQDGQ